MEGPILSALPERISGAIYANDPIFIVSKLTFYTTPAIPKSTILITVDPFFYNNIFSNFKSL
jgi:hypothetical protein